MIIFIDSFGQFRDTKWGMSIHEVKEVEKAKIIFEASGGRGLIYETFVFGPNTQITYFFTKDDKLASANYEFNIDNYEDHQDYMDEFTRLKRTLCEKYGKPIDDYLLYNDEYLDNYNLSDHDLFTNEFNLVIEWETNYTLIDLVYEYSISWGSKSLNIKYYSKRYEKQWSDELGKDQL